MKTQIVVFSALILSSAYASANPPQDCGVNTPRGNPTYCGTYNGGHLICSCDTDYCVTSTYQVNPSNGAPGLCTSGPNAYGSCSNTNPCDGYSKCVNGTCCIPRACGSTDCGTFNDTCGSTENCMNGSGCQPINLSVDSTWYMVDFANVTIQHAAHMANATIAFTDAFGNEWDVSKPEVDYEGDTQQVQTDSNGNYSNSWYVDPNTDFGNPGNWSAVAKFTTANASGFTVSNRVYFTVSY